MLSESSRLKGDAITSDIKQLISARQSQLIPQKEKIKPFNEEIALVAFDFTRKTKDEVQVNLLLKALQDLKGDYYIQIRGYVDNVFKQKLSPGKEKAGFKQWQSLISPKTTAWKVDDMHLVSMKKKAETIPYNLTIMLNEQKTKKRSFLPLGWYKE